MRFTPLRRIVLNEKPHASAGKNVNQKKRSQPYQSDTIPDEPIGGGGPEVARRNGVIADQTKHARQRGQGGSSHSDKDVSDHVATAAQSEVDTQRPAQNVSCSAVPDGNAHRTNCSAEREDWLVVNQRAGERIRESHQNCVPWADTEEQSQNQSGGGIPGRPSQL